LCADAEGRDDEKIKKRFSREGEKFNLLSKRKQEEEGKGHLLNLCVCFVVHKSEIIMSLIAATRVDKI
jgi:hypothetical protein